MFVLKTRSALHENAWQVGILAGASMNITDIIVRSETVASRKNNVGKDRMKLNNHLKKN